MFTEAFAGAVTDATPTVLGEEKEVAVKPVTARTRTKQRTRVDFMMELLVKISRIGWESFSLDNCDNWKIESCKG
jgi:hypothetical protein